MDATSRLPGTLSEGPYEDHFAHASFPIHQPEHPMPSAAVPTALRVVVTMMVALAAVSQVAYLDALSWHVLGLAPPMTAQMRPPFLTLMTAHAIVSVVSGVLAIALVLNEGPRQSAARGLGLALGAWSYLTAYSGVTLLLRPDAGAWRTAFEAHFLAIEVAGLVGLLRFTALFPSPLADRSLEPPPTLPTALRPFHAISVWMLGARAPLIAGVVVLGSLWGVTAARGLAVGDAGLSPLMDFVRFLAAGLVVLNLRKSWSRANPEDAGRLAWLFIGLAFVAGALLLLVGGNVLLAVTDWPEPVVAWRPLLLDLALVAFLVAVAMGILYRGGIDAARSARKIGALATVASLGLFLAAALEALFTGGALGGGAYLGTGVGTLVAFVVLVSTHRGLVRWLEGGLEELMGPGGALT